MIVSVKALAVASLVGNLLFSHTALGSHHSGSGDWSGDSGSGSGDWSGDSGSGSGDWSSDYTVCGCEDCTNDILDTVAGEYTCAERIEYLKAAYQLSEKEACIRIGRIEFPFVCGPSCDPGRCDGKSLPEEEMPSSYCGCKDCTDKVWNRRVEGHTCGARITYLTDFDGLPMLEACNIVGAHEFPEDDECGLCACDSVEPPEATRCGCSRCTDSVWNLDADGSTCGERIKELQTSQPDLYPTEADACRQVAGKDHPHTCGSNCNPDLCDAPLTARTPLYCFPDFDERIRLRNMWGNHSVEVKESIVEKDGLCGPQDNKFTSNTITKLNKKELKLQFKKVGEDWEGSEVRVRLPNEDMPFRYGNYSFSVKSIEVLNTNTDLVESYILPPSLVLGLHTYDTTENFAIQENFNHEVGIDISRFDGSETDARFSIQPAADDFNSHSFYTGQSKSYQQSPRRYSFDWSPAKIKFEAAGQDFQESFTYSTERALDAGELDYSQCLPANIEIRLKLWNLWGTLPPTNIESDHHIVEVVIDDFNYQPSGLEYVPNGGVCSKDCHCHPASRCYGNICAKVLTHYEIVASSSSSSSPSGNDSIHSSRTIAGLTIFSFIISILALMTHYAIRMRYQPNRSEDLFFNLSPQAVKA